MASDDTDPPKCHVCSSLFVFSGPAPRLLPCLHSVCQICIALDFGTIFCSTCKQHFTGNDTYPHDAVQEKSIFLATFKNKPSEVCCTNRNDGRKALYWCPHCEALLCDTCEETHKDMKLTKSHEVKSLSSLLKDQKGISPKSAPCPHHAELNLSLYDETCEELICYRCKSEDHARCVVTTNDTACGGFKETYLPNAMKKLEEKGSKIALLEDEVQRLSNLLGPRVKAVKKSIKRSFDTMAAALNQREKEIERQVEACFKEVEENTKTRFTELNLKKVRLQRVLSVCKSSHGLSFPPHVLGMKSTMVDRVDECLETELPKVSNLESEIKFLNKDEEDLLHVVPSVGVLYSTWSKAIGDVPTQQGILSETRAQLKLCQENYRNAQSLFRMKTEELKNTKGLLHETKTQLKISQQERAQSEKHLDVCVDKLRNFDKEKVSFTLSIDKKFNGLVNSSQKVLKTIPWYIQVSRGTGGLGCYVMPGKTSFSKKAGWSCRVKATFKVQSLVREPITRNFDYVFRDNDDSGRGYADFIPRWVPSEHITLKADVEILESEGLDQREDRLRKEFDVTLASLKR